MRVTHGDLGGTARGPVDPGGAGAVRRGGRLHEPALERYAEWMAGQPIGGVAVWAHTGRGLRLSERRWRRGADGLATAPCRRRSFLVAAAGARADRRDPREVFESVRAMARQGGRPRGRRAPGPPAGRLPRARRPRRARSWIPLRGRRGRPAARRYSTSTRRPAASPTRRNCSPRFWPATRSWASRSPRSTA